jgi:hypothetical protein
MIDLITTFYISKYSSHLDNARSVELEESLLKNLSSNYIKKIHLFVDDNDALTRLNQISNNSEKIVVIEVGKKPKYSDFFKYILDNLKNEICMLTNADIYLHECDLNLIEKLKTEKLCYALTRHEFNMSHPLIDSYRGSHDSYIFNSSFINETIISEHTDFYQNFSGIETHIIKNFCDLGFKVFNPCKQIKIVHLHRSELRNVGGWIGLHECDELKLTEFLESLWCIPPIVL